MDGKLQRAPEGMKASSILTCISRSIGSRSREVTVPLHSTTMRLHLKEYVPSWAPQHKRGGDSQEKDC